MTIDRMRMGQSEDSHLLILERSPVSFRKRDDSHLHAVESVDIWIYRLYVDILGLPTLDHSNLRPSKNKAKL